MTKKRSILETPIKELTLGDLLYHAGKAYFIFLGIVLLLHFIVAFGIR